MKVSFEDGAGYFVAHLSGTYSLQGMVKAIDRIGDESSKRQVNKVLVAVSITGDAPLTDRYDYAKHAVCALQGLKCAAYAGPGQKREIFTEDVAQGRGLTLRVFTEPTEAIRWLIDEA